MKFRLIKTTKYPGADTISGKYYEKYDDIIYHFLTNIVELNPYLVISYPYVFTTSQAPGWVYDKFDINKHIRLDYKPSVPKFFYLYNEIYNKFLKNHKFGNILNIGLEHGFIETLDYLNLLTTETKIHFIGTTNSTLSFQNYVKNNSILATNKHITIENKVSPKLYDLLEPINITSSPLVKANTIIFNYYTGAPGFNFNFAFIQTTINLVSMILALKSLSIGGVFICHMYSIINKSSADIFVYLRQFFNTADLYFPECANKYFANGTWAIFTGFKGIQPANLVKLYDVLAQVQKIYPDGLNDVNIYDEYIRKKCWVVKIIDNTLPHEYINGYLDFDDTHPVYNDIRAFNSRLYKSKYEYTKAIYDLWLENNNSGRYPNTHLLPTYEQTQASIKYLEKWKFGFTVNNVLGTEPKLLDIFTNNLAGQKHTENINAKTYTYLIKTDYFNMKMIDAEFNKRGNWVKYDDKLHKTLDFLYIDGLNIKDEQLYNINAGLKNIIGDNRKEVTVKYNLYDNLIKIPGADKFLPKTIKFDIKNKPLGYLNTFRKYFINGRPMICKIGTMGEGMNIITTDKFAEFYAFMKPFFDILKKHPNKQFNKWVLQEYIDNPYLINGRKFHIRLHLIYQPGDKPSYYIHNTPIALADATYVHGDWTNKKIHDTHFGDKLAITWPEDFYLSSKDVASVYKQYDFICSSVISNIQGDCYSDAKNCFQMFGLDLMITDDLQVKLIEVNAKIGIRYVLGYQAKLFRGIMKLVVDNYYPPLNKQIMPGNFFEIPKLSERGRDGRGTMGTLKTKPVKRHKPVKYKTLKTKKIKP